MHLKSLLRVTVAGLALTGYGAAQSAAQESGEDGVQGEAIMLGTITLNALKRPVAAADIPASLTVIGANEIREGAARRETVLAAEPNVTFGPVTARLYTTFLSMRGIGSALVESDPSIGFSLDGVSFGASQAFGGALLDLAHIEVMRGPQGTLYGRNTLGGTINIVSNMADPDISGGHATLGAGSSGLREGEAVFNTPLGTSGWALRGAVMARNRDGDFTSSVTGRDLGGEEVRRGRISLTGPVSDSISFEGFVDLERQTLPAELFGLPIADWRAGRSLVAVDDPTRTTSDTDIASAKFSFRLDNGDLIESQTAWLENRVSVSGNGFPQGYFAAYDAMFASFGLPGFRYRSDNPFDGEYRQLSQELHYVHQSERLDLVAGLYAEKSEADRLYGAYSRYDYGEMRLATRGQTETTSVSVFADGTWHIDDRLSLFGGLRLGRDRKSFDYSFESDALAQAFGLAAAFEPSFSDAFSETYATPRAGISYRLSPEALIWASVSRGYKSGGFNAGFVGLGDAGHYASEDLTAWEIGLRSSALEGRLQLEGALFLNDWKNQQVQGFNPLTGTTPIMNAPESHSAGVELSAQLQLDQGWQLGAAFGYTDATYRDFTNAPAPGGTGVSDASGNFQQFVSRRSATLSVAKNWALENGWGLRADLAWSWRSSYWLDVQNTIEQPAYGLLNGAITLSRAENSQGGGLDLTLWGRNLLDEGYITTGSDLGSGPLVSPGEGRIIGISLTSRF